MYSTYGLVNNSLDLIEMTITCTVDSVSPAAELNLLGGDNLRISGTNLPSDLQKSLVDIRFTDA